MRSLGIEALGAANLMSIEAVPDRRAAQAAADATGVASVEPFVPKVCDLHPLTQ
jgi:hypothetical protein